MRGKQIEDYHARVAELEKQYEHCSPWELDDLEEERQRLCCIMCAKGLEPETKEGFDIHTRIEAIENTIDRLEKLKTNEQKKLEHQKVKKELNEFRSFNRSFEYDRYEEEWN